MVDLVYYLTNWLFFDIPLLSYYINLRSSIIFCIPRWDIYLSLGISLSCSVIIISGLFCGEILQVFVILLAILLPIKSPVISAVFWITFFEVVLSAFVADCLTWSRSFWLYLLLTFLLIFLPIFLLSFLTKDKN